MNTKHIKFLGTGDDENEGQVCAGDGASDSTLCGYTMDYDDKTAGDWITTTEKINCRQCIQIIETCKSIKKSEYNS